MGIAVVEEGVMDEVYTRDWDQCQPGQHLHQLLLLSQGRVMEVLTGADWEGLQQGSQGRRINSR